MWTLVWIGTPSIYNWNTLQKPGGCSGWVLSGPNTKVKTEHFQHASHIPTVSYGGLHHITLVPHTVFSLWEAHVTSLSNTWFTYPLLCWYSTSPKRYVYALNVERWRKLIHYIYLILFRKYRAMWDRRQNLKTWCFVWICSPVICKSLLYQQMHSWACKTFMFCICENQLLVWLILTHIASCIAHFSVTVCQMFLFKECLTEVGF